MSNPDSFIDEVTEELRRDRVAGFIRKYGLLIVLAVLALVGGAAWNEWRKAQETARAQAFGDALLAALDTDSAAARLTALEAIPTSGAQSGLVQLMRAGALFETDRSAALMALQAAAADPALPDAYRQLAALKHLIAAGTDLPVEERRSGLERLAQPGQPFRPLALEQLALLHLVDGDTAAARAALDDLLAQSDVSEGLRRRASQLNIALGGAPDAN